MPSRVLARSLRRSCIAVPAVGRRRMRVKDVEVAAAPAWEACVDCLVSLYKRCETALEHIVTSETNGQSEPADGACPTEASFVGKYGSV